MISVKAIWHENRLYYLPTLGMKCCCLVGKAHKPCPRKAIICFNSRCMMGFGEYCKNCWLLHKESSLDKLNLILRELKA